MKLLIAGLIAGALTVGVITADHAEKAKDATDKTQHEQAIIVQKAAQEVLENNETKKIVCPCPEKCKVIACTSACVCPVTTTTTTPHVVNK